MHTSVTRRFDEQILVQALKGAVSVQLTCQEGGKLVQGCYARLSEAAHEHLTTQQLNDAQDSLLLTDRVLSKEQVRVVACILKHFEYPVRIKIKMRGSLDTARDQKLK